MRIAHPYIPPIRTGARAAAALALVAALLLLAGAVAASAASAATVTVGRAPRIPLGSSAVGGLPASTDLHFEVILQPSNPAGLAALANAVSDPGSSVFHHYLPPGQFALQFGATPQTVAAVDAALLNAGLQPGSLSANRLMIPVTASATTVSHGLGVGFERYRVPGGRVAYANTAAPRLPTSVAASVQGMVGLDNLYVPHRQLAGAPANPVAGSGSATQPRTAARPAASGTVPQACPAATQVSPSNPGAVGTSAKDANDTYRTIDQVAQVYSMGGLYSRGDFGQGVTVAVYELEQDQENPGNNDIPVYKSCFGVSSNVTTETVDGGAAFDTDPSHDPGLETELDVENVIGLASQANVIEYQGPNTDTGAFDTYAQIMTDDTARVVSTSWGLCEADSSATEIAGEATLFEQAATQGQTVFSASGDDGSEDCDGDPNPRGDSLQVDDPASQPDVTGAGGTSLTPGQASPLPRIESVWNDASIQRGAGGGGLSEIQQMPSYQSSNGITNNTSAPCMVPTGTCREVPDVSANADPATGYVIYWDGTWTHIGGTSGAAPTWAGLTALIDSDSACGGKSVGFLNPALYTIGTGSSAASAFNDITTGNNDYLNTNGGLFAAAPGYDMASGFGTPIATGLASQLCALDNPPPPPPSPPSSPPSASNSNTAGGGTLGSQTTVPPVTSPTTTKTSTSPNAHVASISGFTLVLQGHSLVIRTGRRLDCSKAGATCLGEAILTTTARIPSGHTRTARIIGIVKLTAKPGHDTQITLKLNSLGLKLLSTLRKLGITETILSRAGSAPVLTQTHTLTLNAPRGLARPHKAA